jgi:hypothetical protein
MILGFAGVGLLAYRRRMSEGHSTAGMRDAIVPDSR